MKDSFNAARRAGRADYYARKEARHNAEPEPSAPDPIIELAEICAELHEALDIIGVDMPNVQKILIPLRDRINKLRWPE